MKTMSLNMGLLNTAYSRVYPLYWKFLKDQKRFICAVLCIDMNLRFKTISCEHFISLLPARTTMVENILLEN